MLMAEKAGFSGGRIAPRCKLQIYVMWDERVKIVKVLMHQVAYVASAVAKIKGWFSSIRLAQSVSQVNTQTVQ